MKPATSGALCDLPIAGRWDFGGFAYGLEPLVLPPVGAPDATHFDPACLATAPAYAETCWQIRSLGEPGGPVPGVEPCEVPEELFWFRWITGHQVCFAVWRLIAQILDEVHDGRCSPNDAIEPICRYVDGYSAMLLYTGSCPSSVYNVHIRPSMRLRHRAFSGSWAPDYWPIRELFRRRLSSVWGARAEELTDAVALLHLVHDGIAARLVADGRSLLREASVRGPNHRMAGMIYDTYFMTLRAPVARHEVVVQLLRRLVAIAKDIAVNGLLAVDDGAERPPELQAAEVLKCESSLNDILLAVARHACGTADELVEPSP
jgi:hypothetical protein